MAEVLDVRPRIFLRDDTQFEGLTFAKLRQHVRMPEFAAAREKWLARPSGRAILWKLDGRQEDFEAAAAGLRKMEIGSDSWSYRGPRLIEFAALFDWLYSGLDDSTRQAAVAKLEQAADSAVEHVRGGQAPFFYTRTPGALAGLCVAGLSLHGVSDKADGYLKTFREFGVREYFAAYDWVDGAATGATYTLTYTYVDLPSICAAWWSATGRNPNEWIRTHQGAWLDGMVRFYLWYMRPGFAFTNMNDQFRGDWDSHDQFCQGLDLASYVTRDGYGRAWSQRWLARFGSALYHPLYSYNLVFRDPDIPAKSLADLPRAELFGRDSCGYGFIRSDWPKENEPDTATHVFFRCGDPIDVHGGVSAGEFQIFKFAPLATRGGRYTSYDSPPDLYHRNCISANVVLFTDPAVPDDRGDQNSRRGLKSDHRTWAQWLAIREQNGLDVAHITHWQVGPQEVRCRADLTATNPENKCRQWIREFVWMGNKHLAVLDIVETAKPEIRRQWQLHLPARPIIGNHHLTVVNHPPEQTWADPRLELRPAEARLLCHALVPQQYKLTLYSAGKAETLDALGKSLGAAEGNVHHLKHGQHVVQIEPLSSGSQTVFLHVLTAAAKESAIAEPRYRLSKPGTIELTVDGATTSLSVPDWFRP